MTSPVKFCDHCGAPARLEALECRECGYAFRVNVGRARRQALGLPEPEPPASRLNLTPPTRAHIALLLFFAVFILIGLFVLCGQIVFLFTHSAST